MANEKNKEIAEETSGKDNKRSVFIETSVLRLGGTYVLFTTRLNRCQSIHRLHVFPARPVSKAPSADRYRADIRTISRRSSRGNLHHWEEKVGERTSSRGRITIDRRVLDVCSMVSSLPRRMSLLRNAV